MAVSAAETDLRLVMLSMGKTHSSIAVTGAICTAVAVKIPGTLPHAAAGARSPDAVTRIGHPAGIMTVSARPEQVGDDWRVERVAVFRTARRLFEGGVYAAEEG